MQLVNKLIGLLIKVATLFIAANFAMFVFLFLGSIPPFAAPAQNESMPKDTVLIKAKELINRVDAVAKQVDNAAIMVDSNATKAQQILAVLDNVKSKTTVIRLKPRTIVKEKKVYVQVLRDTTLYYVEGQYVNRPIIKIDACNYRYGGDTFRNNMWKGRNEDGILKGLFKKKKK